MIAVIATSILMLLAGLTAPWPTAAALLMAITGLAIGASSRLGLHPAAVQASVWPATTLIAARFEIPDVEWASQGIGQVLVPAFLAIIGGLWAMLLSSAAGKKYPRFIVKPVDSLTAKLYALSLAVFLGIAAFMAATWMPGTRAGWALLSILVIVKPSLTDTRQRLLARSAGTVLGGLLAAGVSFLVPSPDTQNMIGALLMLVAIGLYAKGTSYAGYALALTASIILMASQGHDVLLLDLQRVGMTLAASVLVAFLAAVFIPVARIRLRNRE